VEAGAAPVPVALAAPANDPATNMMTFPAVELNTFLTFYAEFLGRTILRPSALPAQTITLKTQGPLTRREMVEAMDTVLAMNGIATILVGDKFVKVVQTASAVQEAAAVSKLSFGQLPEAAQYLVHIVQLKYVKPSEILPVLTPFSKIANGVVSIEGAGIIVLRDFAENVKRMLQIVEMVDVAYPAEFEQEVIPIKYAKASEIANALSSLSAGGGGGGTSVGGTAGGTTGGVGGTGGRSGFGGGRSSSGFGARGGAGGSYGGSAGGMGGVGGASPFGGGVGGGMAGGTGLTGAAGAASFGDRLRSIITKASGSGSDFQIIGPNKILADENSNQLLVFASKTDLKTIKEIIAKLDTISPQVLIESLILEVALNNSFDISFDYAYAKKGNNNALTQITKALPNEPPQGIGDWSTNVSGAFNWMGKANNGFYYHVNAAAAAGRVSVLSRPRIQTSHAMAASFFVGESRPYPTGTSYGGYGGNYSQIQQLNIGITLNVTPLINQDGLVVLEIQQQISSFGGNVTIQNVGDVPITTERDVQSKVSVRTGETIVVGGFISADNSKNNSGVPFLKDIPLLGYLFRGSSTSNKRQELIVLIRPTVLPNPMDAAIAAAKLKASMPLTRTAEVELQQDWEKFQRIADAVEERAAKHKARTGFSTVPADPFGATPQPFQYGPPPPNFMTNTPPAVTP
jgi:general secretion pathway protein D